MKIPKYITALSRHDLEEIAAMVNPIPGPGMEIDKAEGKLRISINVGQLKRMMWAFSHNGGFQATVDQLDGISLDPGEQH